MLITQPPKSGKNRSVNLPPFLCTILNDHLTRFSSSGYRIVTVSMKTNEIVAGLPKLKF